MLLHKISQVMYITIKQNDLGHLQIWRGRRIAIDTTSDGKHVDDCGKACDFCLSNPVDIVDFYQDVFTDPETDSTCADIRAGKTVETMADVDYIDFMQGADCRVH